MTARSREFLEAAVEKALKTIADAKAEILEQYDPNNPRPDALYHRLVDDEMEITVYRMGFAYRVCYGETGPFGGFEDGYCFKDRGRALEAAAVWDGKSKILDGWHRNPYTGVRREDGDPAKEYYRK